jgi:transcription initiation factor TFIIB
MVDIDALFSVFDKHRVIQEEEECDNSLCKNCKSTSIVDDFKNGTTVCIDCGLIKEEILIDEKAEWNFGGEEAAYSKDPSRCGGPTNALLEKSSLSTMINTSRAKGNNYTMAKIHQQQSMNYVERSLYHVFEGIQKMAGDRGSLSQAIIEQSKAYYKKISEKRLSRGAVRKGLIACCILYACKAHNVPRSVKEIGEMCEISVGILNKTTKIFTLLMKDEINNTNGINVDDLISRFCNVFQFEHRVHHSILRDVRKVHDYVLEHNILHGKTPTSVASGIIYFVLQNKGYEVDKNLIATQHKVSFVTINKIQTILGQHDFKKILV